MNVTEAVLSRRSTRAFLDRAIPLELLRGVLEKAARAPSNSNLQPWLVRVVTGPAIERLRAVAREHYSQTPPSFDPPQFQIYPDEGREPYATRRFQCGERQYGRVGLAREDRAGRMAYVNRNLQFFDAPAGLFVFIEDGMGPSQWADLGCFIQTVMLLLREEGLDSCAQISWTRLNKTVAEFVGAEPNWLLYCGLSIGYRDPDAPINSLVQDRAGVDEFAKFIVD